MAKQERRDNGSGVAGEGADKLEFEQLVLVRPLFAELFLRSLVTGLRPQREEAGPCSGSCWDTGGAAGLPRSCLCPTEQNPRAREAQLGSADLPAGEVSEKHAGRTGPPPVFSSTLSHTHTLSLSPSHTHNRLHIHPNK